MLGGYIFEPALRQYNMEYYEKRVEAKDAESVGHMKYYFRPFAKTVICRGIIFVFRQKVFPKPSKNNTGPQQC